MQCEQVLQNFGQPGREYQSEFFPSLLLLVVPNWPNPYIPFPLGRQVWAAPGEACLRQGGSELEVSPEGADSLKLFTNHSPFPEADLSDTSPYLPPSNDMITKNSLGLFL